MGAWGWEREVAIFLMIYFQNMFFYVSKPLHFSHWQIKMVYLFTLELKYWQGECLFVSLSVFGQHNFVWAGAWRWEHGGRSLGMGAIF